MPKVGRQYSQGKVNRWFIMYIIINYSLNMILTPNGFLKVGGIVLLVLGILGFILPGGRVLGDAFYLDFAENVAHTVLGIVALIAAYAISQGAQKGLVLIVGIVALVFAVWGFLVAGNAAPNWYGIANLENPLDNLLHLAVGIWAVWAASRKSSVMAM